MSVALHEDWPDKADHAAALCWRPGASQDEELRVYVYRDVAMIEPPPPDYDDNRSIWLQARHLRALATALNWAADRLDSRT